MKYDNNINRNLFLFFGGNSGFKYKYCILDIIVVNCKLYFFILDFILVFYFFFIYFFVFFFF